MSELAKWDSFCRYRRAPKICSKRGPSSRFSAGLYDSPAPFVVVYVVGVAEIVLPVWLVLGLATRFAAPAHLALTGVIYLVVPVGWANFHLYWASLALAIIALGPGRLSLDRPIDRFCRQRKPLCNT